MTTRALRSLGVRQLGALAVVALVASLGGACGAIVDADSLQSQPCPDGQKECGDRCVDLNRPEFGCGAESCDACQAENVLSSDWGCDRDTGACRIISCNGTRYEDCNDEPGDGCEVDVNGDVANCGECGNSCAEVLQHVVEPRCTVRKCDYVACEEDFLDCDDIRQNGCEVDAMNDPDHCGDCETVCDAGQECSRGVCR